MKKKEIIKFLDEIFNPIGFKRRRDIWKFENEIFVKNITLQKSKYGNTYYINYGFIIKCLELNNLEMHVYYRLGSLINEENQKIMDLLDMENNITDEQRKIELKPLIEKCLLSELLNTNTEKDLLNSLNKRPHLNDIPLVVKQHFHLK